MYIKPNQSSAINHIALAEIVSQQVNYKRLPPSGYKNYRDQRSLLNLLDTITIIIAAPSSSVHDAHRLLSCNTLVQWNRNF